MMDPLCFISIGPSVDNGESIDYWTQYVYSQAGNAGGTVSNYDGESAGQTTLEAVSPPDTNVVIGVYDPEIQALLAFE